MAGYKKRKAVKGMRTRRVNVSVDSITDAACKVKAELDGTSFSAAMCQLAMTAVINDPELLELVKIEAIEVMKASMIAAGYGPDFSNALAKGVGDASPQ